MKTFQDTLLRNGRRLAKLLYCVMDVGLTRYFIVQWMKACQETLLCNGLRLVKLLYYVLNDCLSTYFIV